MTTTGQRNDDENRLHPLSSLLAAATRLSLSYTHAHARTYKHTHIF